MEISLSGFKTEALATPALGLRRVEPRAKARCLCGALMTDDERVSGDTIAARIRWKESSMNLEVACAA